MTEKLDLNSLNITEERKAQLKQIFPEIFTENKVDFDKLKMALGDEIEENPERYEMNWAGKKEAFKQVQIPSIGTLRPCKEESVNFDETENLYIEGDNLEVLKLLQKSYYGKIKMIYIDPPYNTGKDFVYKDNFKDNLQNYLELTGQIDGEGKRISANQETAGRYHSNWLNMMYPRLFLARNLLKEDGVIFISIDDNEVINLRKICDEIFGEENFINLIVLENDSRARPYDTVATTHEYIAVYGKSNTFEYEELINEKKEFSFNDKEGGFDLYELRNRNISFNILNRPNLYYPFYVNPKKNDENNLYEVSLEKQENWIEVFPQESQGVKTVWRWSKEKVVGNINKLVFAKKISDNETFQIVKKYRGTTYTMNSVWTDKEMKTDKGTLLTKKIFDNKKVFDFPKPLFFIYTLLKLSTNSKNDVILDFFSGSATTAHAVMQLNAEDGGNRKHIMIQLPETTDENSEAYKAGYKNICEIGKERIRRAGAKINEELKSKNMQLQLGEEPKNIKLDTGFKVLKLDTSNFKEWDNKPQNLFEQLEKLKENTKAGRTQDDILYEIILKSGLSLSEKIETKEINGKKIFSIMSGFLIICLEKELTLEFIRAIAELKPAKVVFLDIGFHNNDQLKTNAVQIMKSIKYDGENSIEFKTV